MAIYFDLEHKSCSWGSMKRDMEATLLTTQFGLVGPVSFPSSQLPAAFVCDFESTVLLHMIYEVTADFISRMLCQ